jgi:hypothetical protein
MAENGYEAVNTSHQLLGRLIGRSLERTPREARSLYGVGMRGRSARGCWAAQQKFVLKEGCPMRITRWIFLIAGILGLVQASPIIYALISSGGSVLPDESILSGYILVSILQYLAWQLVYLLISNAPTRHRLMMIPAIAAALTESFLPTWIYFYGAKLWFLIRALNCVISISFAVSFWLTGRESNLSAANR